MLATSLLFLVPNNSVDGRESERGGKFRGRDDGLGLDTHSLGGRRALEPKSRWEGTSQVWSLRRGLDVSLQATDRVEVDEDPLRSEPRGHQPGGDNSET